MGRATFEAKFERGRVGEERFLLDLAGRGHHVVPVYAAGEGKAPKVYVGNRRLTAADVLSINPKGVVQWFEVKTKDGPSFRYRGGRRGWEHGIDFHLFDKDYRKLAERAPLWLVVCEARTIPGNDLDWEPPEPPRGASGMFDWSDCMRHLVEGPVWRIISFEKAERLGRRVERWSEGKTGWLWPVRAMQPFTLGRA